MTDDPITFYPDDLLATVEQALELVFEPQRMGSGVSLADASVWRRDADGIDHIMQVTWNDIRALVARCREAENNLTLSRSLWDAEHATAMRLLAEREGMRDRAATAEASYQEAQLTIAGLEAERDHHRDNANFLRKSVGECHLMISRDTPEFQLQLEWESTTLPPRLQKIMRDLAAARAEVARLRNALTKCGELFAEIRGDWTDPRSECREGWRIIEAALEGER